MKVMGNNQAAAIRNARTACTSAQNAGTLDSMRYAQSMGVEIQKKWRATLDGRTRDSHGSLDGECVGLDETFPNGLRFPGDPDGSPGEVYNCRCTMENYYPGISDKLSKGNRRMRDPETGENEVAENITYTEWVKKKESENPDAWNLYTKKIRNLSTDKKQYYEYRSVLGNKAPKSIDEFQNLKYTKLDEWENLKSYKRYITRVPEATESDYELYKRVKATGVFGTIRIPPLKIDVSSLSFKDSHAAMHGCSIEDALGYVNEAFCSISRPRWDGYSINYFSFDGATYIDGKTHEIKTSFPKYNYDEQTRKMVEVFK